MDKIVYSKSADLNESLDFIDGEFFDLIEMLNDMGLIELAKKLKIIQDNISISINEMQIDVQNGKYSNKKFDQFVNSIFCSFTESWDEMGLDENEEPQTKEEVVELTLLIVDKINEVISAVLKKWY